MAYGTIKVDTIENTNGLTGNAIGPGFKNRIINGAMMIDQRNAGASFTPTTTTAYGTCDRWAVGVSQNSKLTAQQSSTAPTGFNNSLVITSSSAYSVLAADSFTIQQWIEGFNAADLQWGTANAKTVTLSFWVYSSLTGTFGGAFQNYSSNRSYPFTYTINAASTWEQKTVTVAGDTTGTWNKTNSGGIGVIFGLGVGSTGSGTAGAWAAAGYSSATGAVSVVGTNGATWYITGVQLEVGPSATSFDYRPYGTELALCQRYFESSNAEGNLPYLPFACYSGTELYGTFMYKVTKRTTPTVAYGSAGWLIYTNGVLRTFTSIASDGIGVNNVALLIVGSGWTGGQAGFARYALNNTNAIQISAEL